MWIVNHFVHKVKEFMVKLIILRKYQLQWMALTLPNHYDYLLFDIRSVNSFNNYSFSVCKKLHIKKNRVLYSFIETMFLLL